MGINKEVLEFFSNLADETRLKIVLALVEGKKTVGEIHKSVGVKSITLSAISHQLRQLHNTKIVSYKRKGREKFYKLSEGFCWCILKDAQSHFKGKTKCMECSKIKHG